MGEIPEEITLALPSWRRFWRICEPPSVKSQSNADASAQQYLLRVSFPAGWSIAQLPGATRALKLPTA
jgi:hypothetical protein